MREPGIVGDLLDAAHDAIDLFGHVASQMARIGTRIREHLEAFVECLRSFQGVLGRKPEALIGCALQGRKVEEQGRRLARLALLETFHHRAHRICGGAVLAIPSLHRLG